MDTPSSASTSGALSPPANMAGRRVRTWGSQATSIDLASAPAHSNASACPGSTLTPPSVEAADPLRPRLFFCACCTHVS